MLKNIGLCISYAEWDTMLDQFVRLRLNPNIHVDNGKYKIIACKEPLFGMKIFAICVPLVDDLFKSTREEAKRMISEKYSSADTLIFHYNTASSDSDLMNFITQVKHDFTNHLRLPLPLSPELVVSILADYTKPKS